MEAATAAVEEVAAVTVAAATADKKITRTIVRVIITPSYLQLMPSGILFWMLYSCGIRLL